MKINWKKYLNVKAIVHWIAIAAVATYVLTQGFALEQVAYVAVTIAAVDILLENFLKI